MDNQTAFPLVAMGPVGQPRALQVEITSHCNLKCKMCPLTLGATLSSVSTFHMKEAVWDEVVTAAVEVGRVILTGFGENATNPKFPAFLKQLDDLGVKTSFTTNGLGMRTKLVDQLAQLKNLEHINVSIDSPDPAIYLQIRGGKLERAWQGLENLVAGLPERVSLTVSSVAMNSNVESLVAMPDLLARFRVEAYIIQGLHDRTSTLSDEDVRRNPNCASAIRQIWARCLELGIRLELGNGELVMDVETAPDATSNNEAAFAQGHTRQCLAPWETPFVDRDGRVFPCCHGDGTAVMGNLMETPFVEVWKSETFEGFRNALVEGHSLPAICRNCAAVNIGPHPRRFMAEVVARESRLKGYNGLRLVVRNTGLESWTIERPLMIGTIGDKASKLQHKSWLLSNRIARMTEERVEPGECATFTFAIGKVSGEYCETFQLVVEGVRWLSETEFVLPLHVPESPCFRFDASHSLRAPNYLQRRWDGITRRWRALRNWSREKGSPNS